MDAIAEKIAQLESENLELRLARIEYLERKNARLQRRILIQQLEQENARLRTDNPGPFGKAQGEVLVPFTHAGDTNLFSYDAMKSSKAFLAFCRRRPPPGWVAPKAMDKRLADLTKKRNGEIRGFMKPKGIWSILKDGEFPTGRLLRWGKPHGELPGPTLNGEPLIVVEWYGSGPQMAKWKQIDGEWVSELVEIVADVVEEVSQHEAD